MSTKMPQYASIECLYQKLHKFSVGWENENRLEMKKKYSTKFDAYQMFVPQPTQIQHRKKNKKYARAKQIGNQFEKRCVSNQKNNSPQYASIECLYQKLHKFSVGWENENRLEIKKCVFRNKKLIR